MRRAPLTRQNPNYVEHDDTAIARQLRSLGACNVRVLSKRVHDGTLRVIVDVEPTGWHLSISHRSNHNPPRLVRYPTWDEIATARYSLLPDDIDVVMHLPPPDEYVALHDTTFHLHEEIKS